MPGQAAATACPQTRARHRDVDEHGLGRRPDDRLIEPDGGMRRAPMSQDGIVCLPIAMQAELAILRVDLNAGRAKPKPH